MQVNESPNCSEKNKMFRTEQRRLCSRREDLNQALKDRWGLDGVIARAKARRWGSVIVLGSVSWAGRFG